MQNDCINTFCEIRAGEGEREMAGEWSGSDLLSVFHMSLWVDTLKEGLDCMRFVRVGFPWKGRMF